MKLARRPDGKGSRFMVSIPARIVPEVERIVTELDELTHETSSRIVIDALRDYHKRLTRREHREAVREAV